MPVLKKITLAIPFVICFGWFGLQLGSVVKSSGIIFSLDLATFSQLLLLVVSLILSCFFFIIFATLASNWLIVGSFAFFASLFPLVLTNLWQDYLPQSILSGGFFVSFLLIYFLLNGQLKTYLSFSPTKLLSPSVSNLTTLILLVISLVFYLYTYQHIKQNGFTIPDSLIDSTLQLMPSSQLLTGDQTSVFPTNSNISPQQNQPSSRQQVPQLTKEQIQILKQNPNLLKQYNIDPAVLDQLEKSNVKAAQTSSKNSPANPFKDLIKAQLQGIVKPYESYIPAVLAVLFFISLKSFTSLLSILVPPCLWLIFLILEKTGFTKYTTEMREVKKLVV